MTPGGYPLQLSLDGRRVVVVGAGRVAARRIPALLEAGADVVIIAPDTTALPPERLAAVTVKHRAYAGPADLAGCWLVHACTDDPAVNEGVSSDADAAGIWSVRADDATRSGARVPAVGRSEDVTVAVTTAGDPRRAAALRDALLAALDTGALPAAALRHHRPPPGGGCVALVGGGPGNAGLVTVRGRRLLAEADVVVADRLAPRQLLDTLSPGVEVVDAGKTGYRGGMDQETINSVLVDRARAGNRVVRLKGGDPFVFGRGGEEAIACIEAGVPVEVVPGVTSAVAVPGCAGIPVTHRGVARGFAVLAASPGSGVDWSALAGVGADTLVLLMGLARLESIAAELVAGGRQGQTPAAVIAAGTTGDEQVVVGVLDDIAARAAEAKVGTPALVVVGDVVRLRQQLAGGQGQPRQQLAGGQSQLGERLVGGPRPATGRAPA